MADCPTPRPTPPGAVGPDPHTATEPASRADVAGMAHQLRTEMAHLRRDLAFRIDAADDHLEAVLGRRYTHLGLALIAAQCLVTAASVAIVRLTG